MGHLSGKGEMLEFDDCFTLLRGGVKCPDKLAALGSREMFDFDKCFTLLRGDSYGTTPRG